MGGVSDAYDQYHESCILNFSCMTIRSLSYTVINYLSPDMGVI